MANGKGIVEFTRKQLYDEIWEISVAGVARKYDLNYAGLIKTCRESSIPFPSSGYWTRRNMGKDVSSEAVNLEGNENELNEWGCLSVSSNGTAYRLQLTANDVKNLKKYGLFNDFELLGL